MSGHAYRINVATDVRIESEHELTASDLLELGRLIALGTRVSDRRHDVSSPIEETIAVEIRDAACLDADHRRNSVDGQTYACGMPATDVIHDTLEFCEKEGDRPCPDPAEHHPYVSPGFEDPAS